MTERILALSYQPLPTWQSLSLRTWQSTGDRIESYRKCNCWVLPYLYGTAVELVPVPWSAHWDNRGETTGDLLSCQQTVHTKLQTSKLRLKLLAVNVKNVLKIAFMHRFFSLLRPAPSFGISTICPMLICWQPLAVVAVAVVVAHLPYWFSCPLTRRTGQTNQDGGLMVDLKPTQSCYEMQLSQRLCFEDLGSGPWSLDFLDSPTSHKAKFRRLEPGWVANRWPNICPDLAKLDRPGGS